MHLGGQKNPISTVPQNDFTFSAILIKNIKNRFGTFSKKYPSSGIVSLPRATCGASGINGNEAVSQYKMIAMIRYLASRVIRL